MNDMNFKWLHPFLLITGMALTGCSGSAEETPTDGPSNITPNTGMADPAAKSKDVMTYEEYVDAPLDAAVTLEAYVQGKQAWHDDKASLYASDSAGAYFIYKAALSEDLYNEMTEGTKIKVTGHKTEWSGEVGVAEGAKIEVIKNAALWIEPALNITDDLGNEEKLIQYQNIRIQLTGMTAEPAQTGSDAVCWYSRDGSGEEGDDLFFYASKDGTTIPFTVVSSLCGKDTDVYKAVQKLKAGEQIDLEGFLYWNNGPNPHVTRISIVSE